MFSLMNEGLHLLIFRLDKVLDILRELLKPMYEVLWFFNWRELGRNQVALLILDTPIRPISCREACSDLLLLIWEGLRVGLITTALFHWREGYLTRRPRFFILSWALLQKLLRTWTFMQFCQSEFVVVRFTVCLRTCIHLNRVSSFS